MSEAETRGTTAICGYDAAAISVRGRNLVTEVMGHYSFTELMLLQALGEDPTPLQVKILDAVMVTIMEHGLVPSAVVTRLTHYGAPESFQGAVAAGLLGVGDRYAGTASECGAVLERIVAVPEDERRAKAVEEVNRYRAIKRPVPGFGHPIHQALDPRVDRLLEIAGSAGTEGRYIRAMYLLQDTLRDELGKPLVTNISAAMGAVIGAAYGGSLAVTGTSGPGMALKTEAMGLAVMLELPMLIVNVQRGGPSTGLPTKTEQSDLLQSLYGRNGESPMPVLAAHSPSDCFDTALEAARISLQHMTPVILLSDGYIANGAEPWRFPQSADIPEIKVHFTPPRKDDEPFLPYARDERLVRGWAVPGTRGLTHRIGGLEKEADTGNVSYDPANHEYMVKIREAKVEKIAEFIPEQQLDCGVEEGDVLLLAWGSTYGVTRTVTRELVAEGYRVGHAHLRYLRPLPRNLGDLFGRFKKVIIPELNNGQLAKVIREKFLLPVYPYNKIQGVPITRPELKDFVKQVIETP